MQVSTKTSLSSPALDATTFSQLCHPIYGLWIICLLSLTTLKRRAQESPYIRGHLYYIGQTNYEISMFLGNEMLSNIFLTISHSLLNHKYKTQVQTVNTMVLQLNSMRPDDAWRYQRQSLSSPALDATTFSQLCHPIYGLWIICLCLLRLSREELKSRLLSEDICTT